MKAWKIQKFFGDVVYDLRNRGLLPVVVLLLIAMVAIPMVISRGSSSGPSLQPTGATAEAVPETQQAVVSYSPGLRDYKKRLDDLSAKDPFAQQFAQAAAAAGQLSGESVGVTGETGTPASSSPSSGSVSTGSTVVTKKKKKKKKKSSGGGTYTYQTDIAVGDVNSTPTPFPNVAPMTTVPSTDTPVLIYFGNTADNSQALFLVSNKVTTASGSGVCLPNPDDCALLSLQAGQTEDLVYAGDGKTYRVAVVQIVQHFTK
jgi:hypothetical protein